MNFDEPDSAGAGDERVDALREDAKYRRAAEKDMGERPRIGYLGLGGWAGDRWRKVEVIGATPKKYRIRAIEKTKLAGRGRWLEVGQTALVPKYAIRFEAVSAT